MTAGRAATEVENGIFPRIAQMDADSSDPFALICVIRWEMVCSGYSRREGQILPDRDPELRDQSEVTEPDSEVARPSKIQALVNNPARAERDWMDVRLVLEASAGQGRDIDWELVASYLEIFGMKARLDQLKDWHGKAH